MIMLMPPPPEEGCCLSGEDKPAGALPQVTGAGLLQVA